jgi:hypothetical protein
MHRVEQNPAWEDYDHSFTDGIPSPFIEPEGSLLCSRDPVSGPCPETDESIPSYFVSVRSLSVLSSRICLGLQNGLLSSGSLTNILYSFLVSPKYVTGPAHLILLNLIVLFYHL